MPSGDAIFQAAAELETQGVPFVLATVVRCEPPTSAKPGAKAIVLADGSLTGWIGGGCAQPAVISVARKAIADGQPRLVRISPGREGRVEEGVVDFGMACHSGGSLDIFLEPIGARPGLLVVGTSGTARALTSMAAATGFDVFVAGHGADSATFPAARQVIDGMDLSGLMRREIDFAVVATQGKRDEEGLEAALGTAAREVAFVASSRKAARLREYLKERGHDAGRVEAIVSPAGLDIGAVTPEEIALSVMAALVKERRSRVSEPPAMPMPKAETRAAEQAVDPVCGMSVDVRTAEHFSDYVGRRFYFCCAGCRQRFEQEPQAILAKHSPAR